MPPGVASDEKVAKLKKLLKFHWRGSILCNNANFPKYIVSWVPTCSYPDILGTLPKFITWLPIFSCSSPEISRKVCHISVGNKLREEIDILETVCLGLGPYPGGRLILEPTNKLLGQSCTHPKNVIKILSFHQKKWYSTF
jgi:hypothetical protein